MTGLWIGFGITMAGCVAWPIREMARILKAMNRDAGIE
jgi:L,D-peptidoglycan transpeptidase YkuD (ErfK/YbiS/YcfS/YnhG family)